MIDEAKETSAPFHSAFAFPGVLAVLALLAGSISASSFALAAWPVGACIAAAGIVLAATSPRKSANFVAGFCILFAGVGTIQQSLVIAHDHHAFSQIEKLSRGKSSTVHIRGTVGGFPQRTTSGWLITLGAGSEITKGAAATICDAPVVVRCFLDKKDPVDFSVPVVPGDRLEVQGQLMELPRRPAPGDPDGWLRARGAVAIVRTTIAKVDHTPRDNSPWPRFLRAAAASSVRCENILCNALPPKQAALLVALTVGRTNLLSDEQKTAFRNTGLLHLFSVSGLHTMLVGALIVFFLRFFSLKVWMRFILVVCAMVFFSAFVGMSSPVIRSAILLCLYEGRVLLRRPIEPLAALGTVATILIIISPRLPAQVDFQMSFLCALTLVLVAPWMVAMQVAVGRRFGWTWKSKLVSHSLQVILVSCAIQVVLLPIYANQFGQVSLISPLANLLLLTIATVALQIAFVFLILWLALPTLSELGISLLAKPLAILDWGAAKLSHLPAATMQLHAWPVWMTALLYFAIATSAFLRFQGQTKPRRTFWHFAPPVLLIATMLVWQPFFRTGDGNLNIWFLDVGQGDSALLQFPDHSAALVDAGPQQIAYAMPTMIRNRGIDDLSFAVATHSDEDHIGGLNEVLAAIPTRILYVGGSLATTDQFHDLETVVRDKFLPVATMHRGAEFTAADGAVHVTVLHPTDEFAEAGNSTNDASVVLRVDFAGRSVLLTGDATSIAESSMIDDGLALRADVLKVGHHGSRFSTSDDFLDAVGPSIAVISCGRNNRFGHPTQEVLDRLKDHGVTTYRTDKDGAVHLTITPQGDFIIEATSTEEPVLQ